MSQRVGRIRDVARETGLSTATISRVMNGAANVSPATRERVLEACQRLDYFPNPAARALSTAKSKTIAAIIPTIEHSIYAKYIAAIEQTLAESGYSLVIAISNGDPETEVQAAYKLLGMGAQAFILSGSDHRSEIHDLFTRRGVPFVHTSVWNTQIDAPTIGYDNAELARKALTYLTGQGHREIAVLHGPLEESDRTRARCEGARAAASAATTLSFFETSLDVAGGRAAIECVLASRSPVTAVLCFSDVLALGTYFGLSDAGLSIPDDISVMGFDNLDWSSSVVPGLTTIDLPARQMGDKVAAELVSHLETGADIVSTELEATIIERQSIAPIATT